MNNNAVIHTPTPSLGSEWTAGRTQAALLLLLSCLPVLGIVLIAPVQPSIAAYFSDVAEVDFLVPMIVTAPALSIALIAPFAGIVADRWGRKGPLQFALVIYAIFGTVPLWLDSLHGIVISRFGLGVAEAIIITIGTTLISDYFTGTERQKYLGYQVAVTTIAGTVLLLLGGLLGQNGWRTPFWMYSVSVIYIVLVARLLREPSKNTHKQLARASWAPFILPLCVTVLGAMIFYVLIVYLPFLLSANGVVDPGEIGLIAAIASLATAAGAIVFRLTAGKGLRVLLVSAFGIPAVGLIMLALSQGLTLLIACALVTSFGTGMIVPTMLNWAISRLDARHLGAGTGLWQSALFLGQFLTPILISTLTAASLTLDQALGVLGGISLLAAITSAILLRGRGRLALTGSE